MRLLTFFLSFLAPLETMLAEQEMTDKGTILGVQDKDVIL
jgi:hypothetical protein